MNNVEIRVVLRTGDAEMFQHSCVRARGAEQFFFFLSFTVNRKESLMVIG
jgi:hypothetical protein